MAGTAGLARLVRSLRPRGALLLWSADRHRGFEQRVLRMGLGVRRVQEGARHDDPVGPVLYAIRIPPGGRARRPTDHQPPDQSPE